MKEEVDVCIIGGGIVGLFCAMEQVKAGKKVRLIDKLYSGSSRYNIGGVLMQGYEEASLPFIQYTKKCWQEAAEEFGEDLGFEVQGAVHVAMREGDVDALKKEAEIEQKNGLTSRYVENQEELKDILEASILSEDVLGAKVSDDDGTIETGRALDTLRQNLIQKGVLIWGSDEVDAFISEDGKIVGVHTVDGDECIASKTFVCTGVWGSKLLQKLDINLPVRPVRCHVLQVIPTGHITSRIIKHRERFGTIITKYQKNGRSVVVYTAHQDPAQSTWSTGVDEPLAKWMTARCGKMVNSLQNAQQNTVSTITTGMTPDKQAYIGAVDGFENLFVAFGMNGLSYAYAAGAGKILAALAAGEEPAVDVSMFNPNRKFGA